MCVCVCGTVMMIWCMALVSLGCFNYCSTFVVIDREFASGLYNKIVQLIEGKQSGCVLTCQKC